MKEYGVMEHGSTGDDGVVMVMVVMVIQGVMR